MKAETDYLHFVADSEELVVEVLRSFDEHYIEKDDAGILKIRRGVRILAWAHFQNGKRLPQPLPFTTLLKGLHAFKFNNRIRILQFRG